MIDDRADGVQAAQSADQPTRSGSIPTSALIFTRVSFIEAMKYNALWHSRLPLFRTGFIKNMPFPSWAAVYGDKTYAVAIWSKPAAPALPQKEWLELRRLACGPDAPKNTASRMLGYMIRCIRREMPQITRLISYSDTAVHTGTIYKATGWTPTSVSAKGDWHRPKSGRPRPAAQSTAPKQRWEIVI
jgi:hypothetical protein